MIKLRRGIMGRFVLIAMTTALLGGCSYTGVVVPNVDNPSFNEKKTPLVLAIDGRNLIGKNITLSPSAVTLTVSYGDALLESIKHRLKGAYKDTYVLNRKADLKEYDYLLSINHNLSGTCYDLYCNFNSRTQGILKDISDTTLLTEEVTDSFQWRVPGSAKVLAFITGITLWIASPITVPMALEIGGSELEKQLSNSNDRIASKLADAIIYSDISKANNKREENKSKLTRPDIKSPLDDVIDSVVVISTNAGTGSGFYVNTSGFIITNAHVVKDYKDVNILMRDGSKLKGMVIDKDKSADLALIKTDMNYKGKLKLGRLETSGVGTTVISIGTPKGLEWSVSKGIISAVRERDGIVFIQTDAAVNPGNSGGPLIDLDKKEVIGVITFKLKESEGLNFAVNAGQIKKSFPYLNTQE